MHCTWPCVAAGREPLRGAATGASGARSCNPTHAAAPLQCTSIVERHTRQGTPLPAPSISVHLCHIDTAELYMRTNLGAVNHARLPASVKALGTELLHTAAVLWPMLERGFASLFSLPWLATSSSCPPALPPHPPPPPSSLQQPLILCLVAAGFSYHPPSLSL